MSGIAESADEMHTLHIMKEMDAAAEMDVVFQAVLAQLGPRGQTPDGTPMPMKLEAWPGGRWFRDLGNGAGHLWGNVQVIKPPALLEIHGPLFMSYPAISHVQYRLTREGSGTRIRITHRAMGLIPEEHRQGVVSGWSHMLKMICEASERGG